MLKHFFYGFAGALFLYTLCCVPHAAADLTCRVDGEEVTFELAYWSDRLSEAQPVGVIQGTDVDRRIRLSITVDGHFTITAYSFQSDEASPNQASLLDGSRGIAFKNHSGTLTVTAKTERLAGYFEITMAGHTGTGEVVFLELTDGVFDLSREPTSATTTAAVTTSSVPSPLCPAEFLYGSGSDEAHLLRTFRDTVLSATPEGREMVRLYYRWGGLLVHVMEDERVFTQAVEEFIELVVPGVGDAVNIKR